MRYKVKISARAKKAYEHNLDYLHKEWGNKVTLQFIERVDKMIGIIQENPFLFPVYNLHKGIRKCVIHERIILYYRINENTIELLLFWNTYRDTSKLKL